VYLRADKGKMTIPTNPLTQIRTLDSYVKNPAYKPITISFNSLQTGFENTTEKQNIVAKMRNLELKDVDLFGFGYLFSLSPIPVSESSPTVIFQLKDDDVYNFEFYYSRASKKDEPSSSEVKARLQDMQIALQAKAHDPSKDETSSSESLPNIQEMFQKVTDFLESKRGEVMTHLGKLKEKEKDILAIKENLQKINIDLKWNLEMGDCEINIVDAEGKHRGGFKVNNTSQVNKMMRKFIETESQLIHTKLGLAQQVQDGESQLDDLRHRTKSLEEKLKAAENARREAEEKYIQAKMEYSEMAMKYNDLEIRNFQLQSQIKKS